MPRSPALTALCLWTATSLFGPVQLEAQTAAPAAASAAAVVPAPPAPQAPPQTAAAQQADLRRRYDEAMALYRANRFHKASVALHDLLQEPLPSALAAEARLTLGHCLETIQLPLLAGLAYRDAVRFGRHTGDVYPRALTAWTQLSVRLDDTLEIAYRLDRLPAQADPAELLALRYLRGLSRLERGESQSARRLLQEAAASETLLGWQARYASALAILQAGDREAAFIALDPLSRGNPKTSPGDVKGQEVLVDRVRDLSTLGMARIRYAQGRFDEADEQYRRLTPGSVYQPRAQYEQAWIGFWKDRPAEAVERLASLRLGREGSGFVPEAELLAAMFYLRTNQHDLADGVLRTYLDQLYPLRVALRDVGRNFKERGDASQVAKLLLGATPVLTANVRSAGDSADAPDPVKLEAATKAVPVLRPVIDALRRDRELSQALNRAARCELEHLVWKKQPTWWRKSLLGQSVLPTLTQVEERAIDTAGVRLQTGISHYQLWMSELNVMALALRREVTVQRLARATEKTDPDPYTGEPLQPFDFIRTETR